MKLFDTIFYIMLETGERLHLDELTEIHAIKSENGDHSYYLNRTHDPDSYPFERATPSRVEFEEYLAYLIINNDPRTIQIEKFVYKLEDESENPFNIHRVREIAAEASLLEILNADHPKIVKRVKKYSDKALLLKTTTELAMQRMKDDAMTTDNVARLYSALTLEANKEGGCEIKFENGKYVYEEQWQISIPNQRLEFTTVEEVQEFFTNRDYLGYTDGRLTGLVPSYVLYYLKTSYKNVHSIRQYLEKQNAKLTS